MKLDKSSVSASKYSIRWSITFGSEVRPINIEIISENSNIQTSQIHNLNEQIVENRALQKLANAIPINFSAPNHARSTKAGKEN